MDAIKVVTPSFHLGDDGTLDTVIVCDHCSSELRYNFDPSDIGDNVAIDEERQQAYDDFVLWAKEDAAENHVCGEEDL